MAKIAAAEPRMPVKVGAQLNSRSPGRARSDGRWEQIIEPRCAQGLRTSIRGQLAPSGSHRKSTIQSLTADAEILGTFASRTYSAATRPTVGDRA